jgi:hypothetical protein
MAANDPRPVVSRTKDGGAVTKVLGSQGLPGAPLSSAGLSPEDAELFASRIRPAWELFDDLDGDPAGDAAAPPAEAPKVVAAPKAGSAPAQDTIIEGVPTVAVGTEPARKEQAPSDGKPVEAKGDAPKPPPPSKPGEAKKTVPARGGKTQIGIGAPDAAAIAKAQAEAKSAKPASPKPVSKTIPDDPGPGSGATKAPKSAPKPAAAPAAARAAVMDDIEIPGTGGSSGILKIGLAAAAVLAVGAIAYGVMGGSEKKPPAPAPVTTTAAAATAVPLPATVPPPPPVEPETPKPAATAAPPATATTTAKAADTSPPAPAAAAAPPKAEAAPKAEAPPKAAPPPKAEPAAKAEPKKAAASPPPDKPPAAPAKKSGSIIRETPF